MCRVWQALKCAIDGIPEARGHTHEELGATMKTRDIKVGIFVLAGLCLTGLVVFLMGDERGLFKSMVEYETVFEDVQGLKRGSPVRMGGVDIGRVVEVHYSKNPDDLKVYVTLSIADREARRIRSGSVASVAPKGLLGDKLVALTPGKANETKIEPGALIRSASGSDLSELLPRLGRMTQSAEQVLVHLEKTTDALADSTFVEDLKSSVHSLSGVMQHLDKGEGYVARLLRDPEEAKRISSAVGSFERSIAHFEQTAAGVEGIIRQVNEGSGLLHDVIYEGELGDQLGGSLEQLGQAARSAGALLDQVREGKGLAGSLLFGDEHSEQLMADLAGVSSSIREITDRLKAGQGTLGALLVDPSVYEDLKLLLGNVSRNRALRALVRYSIQQDEKAEQPSVKDRGTGAKE